KGAGRGARTLPALSNLWHAIVVLRGFGGWRDNKEGAGHWRRYCSWTEPARRRGRGSMRGPFCGNEDTQVKGSRPTDDTSPSRRRRQCPNCGARFTTFERVQLRELTVVKSTGQREPFDRDKLVRSMQVALRKRPIDADRLERVVNGIVRRLESSGESDIPTKVIGEMVMDALNSLDQVAYVRFASVYRNFREAKDFEDFVGKLARERE